jgi:hypothetical protein
MLVYEKQNEVEMKKAKKKKKRKRKKLNETSDELVLKL